MGKFSPSTKGRSWMVTVQIANMEKAGLTKEEYEKPEELARFLCKVWEDSGKGRTAGASVCLSAKGLFHVHMALYGNLTTLRRVAEIFWGSHTEIIMSSGKKAMKDYLLKNPPYDEKGEQVLYTLGLDNIQDNKGRRSDLEEIEDMLEKGYTPAQIMEESFSFRKYEKMIKSAFIDRRIKETPLLKENKKAIWIVGASGAGKSYFYYQLCAEYGEENIYLATDFDNGGLDFYIEQGAPPILFLDEFKGNMRYAQLLVILDKYSRAQIHCRYSNCYCLWNTVVITSIFGPEEVYAKLVDDEKQNRDKIDQLIRRLDIIEYRYKQNGEYKKFAIPASEYINYDDLKQRALGDENGFIPADEAEDNPFN